MIYFKFPFNEKLYSTDNNTENQSVVFNSFDNTTQINFKGNSIETDPKQWEAEKISSENLPRQKETFQEETHEEYVQNVSRIIQIIKDNNLPKLVYSRRKIFTDFEKIDYTESFNNLCTSYPNAFRYFFNDGKNSWMGAFSEVLGKFDKNTHEFETMSLAGTIPVSESWSEKEIEEQKPVSSYIKTVLTNYTESLQVSETYDHISGNIKHLRTDFKAVIHPADLDALISELHPTPAVCGIPKEFCKKQIENTEKFPRELYAGYIKIETESKVYYFVNLRCAKLFSDAVHLFVGGGITALSSPEKEWRETELKSEAVLKNLSIIR